jgi:hypothetical protein
MLRLGKIFVFKAVVEDYDSPREETVEVYAQGRTEAVEVMAQEFGVFRFVEEKKI